MDNTLKRKWLDEDSLHFIAYDGNLWGQDLVLFDGTDHAAFWLGEEDEVLDKIINFLTEVKELRSKAREEVQQSSDTSGQDEVLPEG